MIREIIDDDTRDVAERLALLLRRAADDPRWNAGKRQRSKFIILATAIGEVLTQPTQPPDDPAECEVQNVQSD